MHAMYLHAYLHAIYSAGKADQKLGGETLQRRSAAAPPDAPIDSRRVPSPQTVFVSLRSQLGGGGAEN